MKKIPQLDLRKMRARSSLLKIYLAQRWTIAMILSRLMSLPWINPAQSMRKILRGKILFQWRLLLRIKPVLTMKKVFQMKRCPLARTLYLRTHPSSMKIQ